MPSPAVTKLRDRNAWLKADLDRAEKRAKAWQEYAEDLQAQKDLLVRRMSEMSWGAKLKSCFATTQADKLQETCAETLKVIASMKNRKV